MDLLKAISKRRNTRHFLTDEINLGIIEKNINVANMAPSVGQLKPTRYVVVTDIEIKKEIVNFEAVNNPAKGNNRP